MSEAGDAKLAAREKAVVAARGALIAVPWVGSALEHFISGPLTELRFKRLEQTLSEVMEELGQERAEAAVHERFALLLESVAPALGRAVTKEKRERFRDLLINAAALSEDSPEWDDAELACKLLGEMETPALAIVASIARCVESNRITLTSRPVPQVFCGNFDYDKPGDPQHVLPYDWVVVEYWARWLKERRIIHYSTRDARGGFGGVALGGLGRFLINWTVHGA